MSDFYKNKQQAFKDVADMFIEGKSRAQMIFSVSVKYGFGEKFVDGVLKTLEELNVKDKK